MTLTYIQGQCDISKHKDPAEPEAHTGALIPQPHRTGRDLTPEVVL